MICATPRQKSSALHNSAFIPKCRMTKVHKLRLLCIKTRFPLSVNNAKTSSSSRYCYENLDQYTWQLQTAELPRYTEKGERGGEQLRIDRRVSQSIHNLLLSSALPRHTAQIWQHRLSSFRRQKNATRLRNTRLRGEQTGPCSSTGEVGFQVGVNEGVGGGGGVNETRQI